MRLLNNSSLKPSFNNNIQLPPSKEVKHAKAITASNKKKGLFGALQYFNFLRFDERTLTVKASMLSSYAQHGKFDRCLRLMPFKPNLTESPLLDFHWENILDNTVPKGVHKGGVPLDFALLLIEKHRGSEVEVVTGYNGGTKLKDGIQKHCESKGYAFYPHPTNEGRMLIKKHSLKKLAESVSIPSLKLIYELQEKVERQKLIVESLQRQVRKLEKIPGAPRETVSRLKKALEEGKSTVSNSVETWKTLRTKVEALLSKGDEALKKLYEIRHRIEKTIADKRSTEYAALV